MKFRLAHFLLYIILLFATISSLYLYLSDHETKTRNKLGTKHTPPPNIHHDPHQIAANEILNILKARPRNTPVLGGHQVPGNEHQVPGNGHQVRGNEHQVPMNGPNAPLMRGPDPDIKKLLAAPRGFLQSTQVNRFTPTVAMIKEKKRTNPSVVVSNPMMYDVKLLNTIRRKLSKPMFSRSVVSSEQNSSRYVRLPHDGLTLAVDSQLKRRRNGFFLETFDELKSASDSLLFETSRNWMGLILEPNPDDHKELRGTNRRTSTLNACLSTKQEVTKMKVKVGNETRTLKKSIPSRLTKQDAIEQEIDCYPLNSILAAMNVNKVDYLALSVADSLPEVLERIDWTRMRVDVITIRQLPGAPGSEDKLKNIRSVMAQTALYTEIKNSSMPTYLAFKRI